MIIHFDYESTVSVNSLSVNKTNIVKLFSGKMLMFAKLSLMSFIYDRIENFYFSIQTLKLKLYIAPMELKTFCCTIF